MSTTTSGTFDDGGNGAPLPAIVDWAAGAIVGIIGLLGVAGGITLVTSARREFVADFVTQETVEPESLSPAEVTTLLVDVAWWTGIGLVIAGVLTLAGGIVFVWLRRRERADSGAYGILSSGGLGAIVAGVGSFIPLSPLLGGAVSGYITGTPEQRSPIKSGAFAGLFTAIPAFFIVIFVAIGLIQGFDTIGRADLRALTGAVTVIGAVITILLSTAIAAIGGYVGHWIREE